MPAPADCPAARRHVEVSPAAGGWAAVGIASFTSMLALRICDPLLPQLAAQFGVGLDAAAWTVAGYALCYGAMQLVFGPLGDRHGKVRTMKGATAFAAAGSLLAALAPSLGWLIAARALAGAAGAGIIPLAIARIGDTVPIERRQQALARLLIATLSGVAFGQWVGGTVGAAFGWRVVFLALTGLFAASAVALGTVPERRSAAEASSAVIPAAVWRSVLELWRRPVVRLVVVATAVEGAVGFSLLGLAPARLQSAHHASAAAAAASVALFGAGGLLFALGSHVWLRRLGTTALAATGAAMVGAAALALALSPWMLLVQGMNVAGGFGLYMLHTSLQTLATQMAPDRRGTAVAMFASALFIGQAAGVALGAALLQRGFGTAVFLASAAIVPVLGVVVGCCRSRD